MMTNITRFNQYGTLFLVLIALILHSAKVCASNDDNNILSIPFRNVESEMDEHAMINITAGQVGILDNLNGEQRYGLEYRFKSFSGPFGFRLIPALGLAGAQNGARFIYSDLRHDFYLNRHWLVIPSFGLGLFKDGKDLQLGDKLEFRTGLEFAYQFDNYYRAGVAVFHLSNGGLSSHNPGTEVLVFSFSIPVGN